MSWDIQHTDKIGKVPRLMRALHFIAVSMIEDGSHPGDTTIFANGDRAFYVEREGEGVIAVMIYEHVEVAGYTWVSLSWVRPDMRRKGIHRAMNAQVEQAAFDAGMAYVSRSVAIGNKPMEATMKAEGYKPKRTTYERSIR